MTGLAGGLKDDRNHLSHTRGLQSLIKKQSLVTRRVWRLCWGVNCGLCGMARPFFRKSTMEGQSDTTVVPWSLRSTLLTEAQQLSQGCARTRRLQPSSWAVACPQGQRWLPHPVSGEPASPNRWCQNGSPSLAGSPGSVPCILQRPPSSYGPAPTCARRHLSVRAGPVPS